MLYNLVHLESAYIYFCFPGFNPRKIKDVIDQGKQVPSIPANDFKVAVFFIRYFGLKFFTKNSG